MQKAYRLHECCCQSITRHLLIPRESLVSHSRVTHEHFAKLALSSSYMYRSYTKLAVIRVMFNTASLPVKASENLSGIPSVRKLIHGHTTQRSRHCRRRTICSCHPFSARAFINYHAEVTCGSKLQLRCYCKPRLAI